MCCTPLIYELLNQLTVIGASVRGTLLNSKPLMQLINAQVGAYHKLHVPKPNIKRSRAHIDAGRPVLQHDVGQGDAYVARAGAAGADVAVRALAAVQAAEGREALAPCLGGEATAGTRAELPIGARCALYQRPGAVAGAACMPLASGQHLIEPTSRDTRVLTCYFRGQGQSPGQPVCPSSQVIIC